MDTDKKSNPLLRKKINNFWRNTGYVTNASRVNRIRKYLKEAEEHNIKGDITQGFDLYYQAKREYRLARIKKEIYFRRNWSGMRFTITAMILFVGGLLAAWQFREFIETAFLPLLSVFGGGIGGSVAVLIRVIEVEPDSEVVSHWSWYVIKVITGAALGLITYFAVVSGLNLFSDSAQITKPEGAVVIGFIAGFFESFSTGVLARFAGQFAKMEENKDSSKAEENLNT